MLKTSLGKLGSSVNIKIDAAAAKYDTMRPSAGLGMPLNDYI